MSKEFLVSTGNFCVHSLNLKERKSRVHREFPGKLESSGLSREILGRGIGRGRAVTGYVCVYMCIYIYMYICIYTYT